jgi:predicted GNAT family acetyltransferase
MSAPDQNLPAQLDVTHDEEGNRYLLRSDGEHVGLIDYRADGDVLTMHHTEIRPDARGQGLGAVLVRGALDDVRDRGHQVVPSCWYVREFIDGNAEYRELLASR